MSFDLVFFGGKGDLTWRKLVPALFQAFRHGKLPAGGRILAVARDERSDAEYRTYIHDRLEEVDASKRPSALEFSQFADLLHYRRMDLSQPQHYAGLKHWLDERGADTAVLYLATNPHLFPVICEQLGAAGLNGPNVRVVLEKPLGHDLASAREINRVVRSVFAESQASWIDHHLGKPAVQNLMALRFGNALFEPLWRRERIAESLRVDTRGDHYGRTGNDEPRTSASLDLDFDKAFPSSRVGAYERLLLDAISGRLNLFVRSDEQEQAWSWVMPVLEAWASDPTPPRPYAAGSWGPAAASALVARDGWVWDEEL